MLGRNELHAVALGLTILGLAVLGALTEPAHHPPENQQAQGQTGNQAARQPRGAVATVAPTESAEEEHDGRRGADGPNQPSESLALGETPAQWLMALTGVFALIISACAVWLLKKTLDATRLMAKQGQKSTAAAVEAVRVTREQMVQQLRAYVNTKVLDVELALKDWENGYIVFVYQNENVGNTPAHNVFSIGDVRILPHPCPNDYTIDSPTIDDRRTMTLHPRATGVLSRPGMAYRPLKSGERYYLIVITYYVDVFGNQRATKFCTSTDINPLLDTIADPKMVKMQFDVTEQHNEAD